MRWCVLAMAVSLTAWAAALALSPSTSPASARCAHVAAHPHQVSLSATRKAALCLINKARDARGRQTLRVNSDLQLAAKRHNRRMLAADCFQHKCPGEVGLNRRVRKTGYTKGQKAWGFAEDLGYDNTPRQMVRGWMHSPFNRRNILNGNFRDVGLAVGWGAPRMGIDDSQFATYTVVFGWRRAK